MLSLKWKKEASLVSISTTNGSDDEASDYKVTVVTPIIEESGIDTIFIKAAYNCWSGGERKVEAELGRHPHLPRKQEEQGDRRYPRHPEVLRHHRL